MDPTRSLNDIECDVHRPDVEPILTAVETSTCDAETSGPDIKNVEMAVPVACPDEEPILTTAHSTELMTTEAISFVETDTNAPSKKLTYDIETPGPEMENIEVVPPVVSAGRRTDVVAGRGK